MSATQFGVVVSTGNAIIRRYIYPNNNADLNSVYLGAGEQLIKLNNGPFPSSAAWLAAVNNAVQTALGKPPGDPTCCVVDKNNTVVALIAADAAIDSLPNMTLVQAYAKIPLGSTYDPGTGLFTAPGYTVPDRVKNGTTIAGFTVQPTVIPKP